MRHSVRWRLWRAVLALIVPAAYLQWISWLAGSPLLISTLAYRCLTSAVILGVTCGMTATILPISRWTRLSATRAFFGAAGIAGVAWTTGSTTLAAWIGLVVVSALLIWLDIWLSRGRQLLARWSIHWLLGAVAGLGAAVLIQLAGRFSDEELFVALQAVSLAGWWLFLRAGLAVLQQHEQHSGQPAQRRRQRQGLLALVLGLIAGVGPTLSAYQQSFFPSVAPGFPGISAANPFLCGPAPQARQTYTGQAVFERMLALTELKPNKSTTELAMLALGQRDPAWAKVYRTAFLQEVDSGIYATAPATSKYDQYLAALRVHFYARMRAEFPELFSAAEQAQIKSWLATINRRAHELAWTDWIFVVAFGVPPAGLYQNQEIGAGLLAILQSTNLAADDLVAANQAYLARYQRGWQMRFRNTDDTFVYQPEWINNALFQAGYTNQLERQLQEQSFEWILLQALPDGAPLRYNYPIASSLPGISYLGATLLADPRYIWLSGRATDYLYQVGGVPNAQPAIERPVDLVGHSPPEGSCLIYGDSGLPTRLGPLAPDKIVFRDGWEVSSRYLLLNLRFTGWHRYKATNDIVLIYQGGPLIADRVEPKRWSWLPLERQLHRDKRIPRDNLSGLLVERTGLDWVVTLLLGTGGDWAQDAPFYARVEEFTTSRERDVSTTLLESWHGWSQRRSILFYHDGPVVIHDRAQGPASSQAAINWSLPDYVTAAEGRWLLRSGAAPAELVLIPLDRRDLGTLQSIPPRDNQPGLTLRYGSTAGQLDLATVLLTGEWVGAEVSAEQSGAAQLVRLVKGDRLLTITLPGN